ncbi:MlaD family protein [Actinomadura latina]|uniref:MCE family protein n=1 Tax=Actinomadura latina TaxID=163603 RepID=A0A846YVZ9_9ACTN|nr:MlaD family protein [Actinomadura latina]NKZ02852.1 MCE family protein [Actinomadura latina]
MIDEEIPLPRRLLISAVTLAAVAGLLYVLAARPGRDPGTVLTAEFGRAGQGLGSGTPVKIRGVTVGSVAGVELTGGGRARVSLRLDPGTRVPDTVTASVEPASAFGPKFVDLVPGAHGETGPYLAPGARITRTSDPRDLSDLLARADAGLGAVDAEEVGTIVHTVATGLEGQGARLRETIDQTGILLNVAYRNRANARTFIGDTADLSGAVSDKGDEIVAISQDTNAIIGTAARGRGRLAGFAGGLSDVSLLVAHGFDRRGGQLGEMFRSSERTALIIYAQLGLVGDAVRTGNRLLPLYGELTSLKGPGGKNYLRSQGYLPTDPCGLLIGLCGPGGTPGAPQQGGR